MEVPEPYQNPSLQLYVLNRWGEATRRDEAIQYRERSILTNTAGQIFQSDRFPAWWYWALTKCKYVVGLWRDSFCILSPNDFQVRGAFMLPQPTQTPSSRTWKSANIPHSEPSSGGQRNSRPPPPGVDHRAPTHCRVCPRVTGGNLNAPPGPPQLVKNPCAFKHETSSLVESHRPPQERDAT